MSTKNIEQNLLDRIKEAETDRNDARSKVVYYKKAVSEAESLFIASNILISNLKEELRVHLSKYPHPVEEQREKEIRLFRERYFDQLKKSD